MRFGLVLACNLAATSRIVKSLHLPSSQKRFFHLSSPLQNQKMSMFGWKAPDLVLETVLKYLEDRYDGVIIDSDDLPTDDATFIAKIDASLDHWRSIQRRGIWLKLPIAKASFVPIATQRGFVFHHAEKEYVMMTHWLPESENRLPPNASHQVGVGCVVINDEGKMLMVQEKSGPLKGTGIWKMPTGLTEAGEDLCIAAEREVLEETGITAKFTKLLCFRQAHNALFGKSDLFIVVVLKPLTFAIVPQEEEIIAADWLEPSTLFEQKLFQSSPIYKLINELVQGEIDAQQGKQASQPGMTMQKLPIGFRPGENCLYYVDSSTNESR